MKVSTPLANMITYDCVFGAQDHGANMITFPASLASNATRVKHLMGLHFKDELIALPANIRLE